MITKSSHSLITCRHDHSKPRRGGRGADLRCRSRQTAHVRRASSADPARRARGLRGAGYEGATTDEVARAAGVSQPYVVRLFGSKENLFLAAIDDAVARMLAAFRAALADDDGTPCAQSASARRMSTSSRCGASTRPSPTPICMGSHPAIGPAARRGFATAWRFFRDELGIDADEARAFMAEGMLISTMIGLRLVDDYGSDPQITELFRSCFPTDAAPHPRRRPARQRTLVSPARKG